MATLERVCRFFCLALLRGLRTRRISTLAFTLYVRCSLLSIARCSTLRLSSPSALVVLYLDPDPALALPSLCRFSAGHRFSL